MAGVMRALLIGSNHGKLCGTENDVNTVAYMLKAHGSMPVHITQLTYDKSTRANILSAWENLIKSVSENDIVVIYYSGHGGYVRPKTKQPRLPSHFQFLVPCDYNDDDPPEKWKGILDVEISQMLYRTTLKSTNVTYILDCCHSARLGRAPTTKDSKKAPPVPKVLVTTMENTVYSQIWNSAKEPRGKTVTDDTPDFTRDDYVNPDVVRISAAATDQSAWQYVNDENQFVGIMTEYLAKVFLLLGATVSWRNILLMVNGFVRRGLPETQEPRSAGPDYRKAFSTGQEMSRVFLAEMFGENEVRIEGGRVLGLEEGDELTLIPWDDSVPSFPENHSVDARLYATEVTEVKAFTSSAKRDPISAPRTPVPAWVLFKRRANRWPVAVQVDYEDTRTFLEMSTKFRSGKPDDDCLVEFRQEGDETVLYGRIDGIDSGVRRTVRLDSRPLRTGQSSIEDLLVSAETFLQARNITSLNSGIGNEIFRPEVEVEIAQMHSHSNHQVLATISSRSPPPRVELTEGQRVCFTLRNKSENQKSNVYVTVLVIDAAGKIMVLSRAWEKGIQLSYELPQRQINGLPVTWPDPIPKTEPVYEEFAFLMTQGEIDLRSLETKTVGPERKSRGPDDEGLILSSNMPYHVTHIRYSLSPRKAG